MSGIAQEIRRYSEVRLGRFESTEFGASRETILASRHPGNGTWDAEGDLQSGALILCWASGEATQHSFFYAGGETC